MNAVCHLNTGETGIGRCDQASQGYITGSCLNINNKKTENNKVRAALCVNTPLVPARKGYKMRKTKEKKNLSKPTNQLKKPHRSERTHG